MKKLLLILLCINPLYGFTTLSEAKNYAAAFPELPPIENENVLNPRFSNFHVSITPTPITEFFHWLGLYKRDWSPSDLAPLVNQALSTLPPLPEETRSLSVTPGTELVILGPLYGSFHSLVRTLDYLKQQAIISEDLTFIKNNGFLVFTGNVIDRSPYILETLTLVVGLLAKNPDKVIYLQGTHEHKAYWLNHGLKYELKQRASFSLKPLLINFFEHLPTSLDIRVAEENNSIRITNLDEGTKKPDPRISALIKAENRTISYENHPGLTLLQPEGTTTQWSIFSAPNALYQEQYGFHYDTFVILQVAAPIVNSTLTLFQRDVRKNESSFTAIGTYNIITAQQLDNGTKTLIEVTPENTITLGSTMALTRTLKSLGQNIKAGISAALNQINSHGGINNKLFRVFMVDDQYAAPLARANIEFFRKNISPIILTPVGSPTLAASLDLIQDNKIYVLFPNSGSSLFRNPDLTHIINFRASYASEAEALTYYFRTKLLGKDFAFFYQDDAYGYAPLNGARAMLKKLGIEKWTETSYQTNTVRVEEAVDTIKKANPDVIGLFSVATATIEFIKRLGVEFLSTKKIFAISPLGDDAFKQFLDSMGLKVTFAQVVPNPESDDLEIVREYREQIAKLGKQPDTYSLEGYIAASLTADIFKKIEGPITMDAVQKIIENIKDYEFKGLKLTYNPANRQLANRLWLEMPSGEWVLQDVAELEKLVGNGSTT